MALSDIDKNNYNAIIRFKKSLTIDMESTARLENLPFTAKKVNEYGQTEVRKLCQPQKRLTDKEIAGIVTDYQDGINTTQLEEKYSCHRQTISNHLKKQGVNVTAEKIFSAQETEEIIRSYEKGLNTAEIAEQFGVGRSTILKHLHNNSVRIRTRWDY